MKRLRFNLDITTQDAGDKLTGKALALLLQDTLDTATYPHEFTKHFYVGNIWVGRKPYPAKPKQRKQK